jgi:hypothetical protein
MNYACINQWHGNLWPEFKEKVLNGNYEKVILFGQFEWAWHHQPPHFYEVVNHCKEKNISFEIVTAAAEDMYPIQMDHVNVHWWDTYWIGKTYRDLLCTLEHRLDYTDSIQPKVIDPYKEIRYEHHFISMNDRPHRHRSLCIDLMAKNDLMKYGAISVHQEDPLLYKWRYFNYKQMLLDKQLYNQNLPPKQYYKSFAQLISESTSQALIISEKTATPLILGKPFLVASQMNYHKMLSRMGFELYDEIFDYTFDTEPDEEKRYDMIMKNFVRLCGISLYDLRKLQMQLAPKIKRNQNRAKEITYDLSLYPKIVLDVIDYYHKTGIELDPCVEIHLNLQKFRDLT